MINYCAFGIIGLLKGAGGESVLGAKYHVCDICGTRIDGEATRYMLKMSVFAAYERLQINAADISRDYEEDIRKLVEEMEEMDPKRLEEDVAKHFNFDLCRPCQRKILRDPLGTRGERQAPTSTFDVDEFIRKLREEQ